MVRGYQYNFSDINATAMHDREGRERKAQTMIEVLCDYYNKTLKDYSLLDVGSSTGIIDNFLAVHLGNVMGIDIDKHGVNFAQNTFKRDNLQFAVDDAMNLSLPNNSFDIVICAQIYEHVPSAKKLMSEIFRVLKKNGVCYFAAGNRFDIMEHHHHLPFLSAIPRPLAHIYMRIAGKDRFYYEKHLSFWGLKKLVRDFELIDYTKEIINNPSKFQAGYMIPEGTFKAKLARMIVNNFFWLCPGYIWLLKKL